MTTTTNTANFPYFGPITDDEEDERAELMERLVLHLLDELGGQVVLDKKALETLRGFVTFEEVGGLLKITRIPDFVVTDDGEGVDLADESDDTKYVLISDSAGKTTFTVNGKYLTSSTELHFKNGDTWSFTLPEVKIP